MASSWYRAWTPREPSNKIPTCAIWQRLAFMQACSQLFSDLFSMSFGVEPFGHRGYITFIEYHAVTRLDNVLTLLIVTLVIGLLMLTLGDVLGFFN